MIRDLSLKTKMFLFLAAVLLAATGPLIAYSLKTSRALADLGTDPAIEASLSRSIELSQDGNEKQNAAAALKKYRQIQVLKRTLITRDVLLFSMAYSIIVLLFALAIGYLFISRITKPLQSLTLATRKIGAKDLDYRIGVQAGGEVGELIESFNQMAGDLSRARRELSLAERKAAWAQVARTIAHEIKNPLTPIRLSTERLYDKFLNESKDFPAVIRSTTSTILAEIGNLEKLVDTFHRYAKFPDPVLRLESMNAILADAADLYRGQAEINCHFPDNIPDLSLDRGQMREAITNLIKNAVEAAQDAKRSPVVGIQCRLDHNFVVVRIEDNGGGIQPEDQKKIFQLYFTTKEHGSGIGLALTERIIGLHGGSISFQSTPPNGSCFVVSIPVVHSPTQGE